VFLKNRPHLCHFSVLLGHFTLEHVPTRGWCPNGRLSRNASFEQQQHAAAMCVGIS